MTNQTATISLRSDLICKPIWMGSKQIWVVKDPLSRSFSYFSQQEYEMLRLANGQRSIDQIVAECQKVAAPLAVSRESVMQFFGGAHRGGVVLVDGAGLQRSDQLAPKRNWWRNPLAVRFPGINPDRFLNWLVPILKPWFRPALVGLAMLLMVIALLIVLIHFSELADNLRSASTNLMTGQGVIALMVVVSTTKIIHELAHAVACKIFGGDVLEMGVMFLVGTPCLYCDVSDAWLFPQRWKRILVSAAGILAELTIASLAAIVWLFVTDGPIRDLCVIVMMVCSVTTILFNGNPLLRYDGYFILSDLVGIPNLATEAGMQVRQWFRRLFWGPADRTKSSDHGRFVGYYGIASGLYRVLLYSMIGWMLYSIAKQHDLGGIVAALMLAALGTLGWKWMRSILMPPTQPKPVSRRRPLVVAASISVIAIVLGMIPLPHSITTPMSVQPSESQTIFVTRPGRVVDSVAAGSRVEIGTVIARIENLEMERELAASRAERDRLQTELAGLRNSRASRQVSSARIESIERAFTVASKQTELLEQNARDFVLTSPCNGQVFCDRPNVADTDGDYHARFWTGSPIEPSNRGAWLETGTKLCLVGNSTERQAIMVLGQQQVEFVRAGQQVSIRLADQKRGRLSGRVIGVASSPATAIADELAIAAQFETPATPHYLVRVQIDPHSVSLPIRTTGRAKIHVDRASVFERISRFLADTFG